MDQTDLLEALDRLAARAVSALDSGIVDSPPPPLERPSGRRRPLLPLLVAAALVVVALVGIGLALDRRDDERSTIADDGDASVQTDDGELTRLALADPEALGYEVRGAFDGPSIEPVPGMEGEDMRHVAHGPADVADPWADVVVSMETPAHQFSLVGEVVDLGGPDAVHLTVGEGDQVVWLDGDRARSLVSARVLGSGPRRARSVRGGRRLVREGPLPGHEVLLDGVSEQFRLGLLYASTVQTGWQAVAYAGSPSGPDFVIGLASWRHRGAAGAARLRRAAPGGLGRRARGARRRRHRPHPGARHVAGGRRHGGARWRRTGTSEPSSPTLEDRLAPISHDELRALAPRTRRLPSRPSSTRPTRSTSPSARASRSLPSRSPDRASSIASRSRRTVPTSWR